MCDLLMEWVAFLEKSYYWVIGSDTKLPALLLYTLSDIDEFFGETINT